MIRPSRPDRQCARFARGNRAPHAARPVPPGTERRGRAPARGSAAEQAQPSPRLASSIHTWSGLPDIAVITSLCFNRYRAWCRVYENLSNEKLLFVWERTRRMLSALTDGVATPAYPESLYRWHIAAEAELERRGFVEVPPGIWTRRGNWGAPSREPRSNPLPTGATVTIPEELIVVG